MKVSNQAFPPADPNKFPDQVVIFDKNGQRELWFTKKVGKTRVWAEMTKYSRHASVLEYMKGAYEPKVITSALTIDAKNLDFSDGAHLHISLIYNKWFVLKDSDEKKEDKKLYKDIIMFDTKEIIQFTHFVCGKKDVIKATLKPPHTVDKVCSSIVKACQKKFDGFNIWEFSDHIYPEALYLRANVLTMGCGS